MNAAWLTKVRASALARAGLFAAAAGLLGWATAQLVGGLGWTRSAPVAAATAGALLRQLVPTLGAYLLLVLWIERRRPAELAWRQLLPGTAAGLAGGGLLIGAVMGVLWLAGAYQVQGLADVPGWLRDLLVIGLGTAVAEEIVFRGVLFRLVSERHGDGWALGVSALLFGALHLGNPGATLWTSFAIAVEAGVLLGMLYAATRSLWPCIGLHAAWNFLEGTVFGSPVSGQPSRHSFLQAEFAGPDWLTGGAFGIEASLVTVALCLAASGLLLAARRRLAPVPLRLAQGGLPC